MGFERAENSPGTKLSWRWQTRTEHGALMVQAELLGDNGITTKKIKHANVISFTSLKSFAFDQRFKRKDAHDLIYCIEHASERLDAVAAAFDKERNGKHRTVVENSLAILRQATVPDS